MSTGETDLETLLTTLDPRLDPEPYVFCVVAPDQLNELRPLATFQEDEGLSVVLTSAQARAAGLEVGPKFKRITLSVHSSLEAVGLTAAVSNRLAEAGISANVIAAYHHDHVFVPASVAQEALKVLGEISKEAGTISS